MTLFTAFTNYDFKHIPSPASLIDWVGAKNFFVVSFFFKLLSKHIPICVLSDSDLDTFATTLQITLGDFHSGSGTIKKFIKFRRIFGIIFLLPWTVPAFITIMSFSNIFNDSVGAINTRSFLFLNNLPFVDISAISWKTDPNWTKSSNHHGPRLARVPVYLCDGYRDIAVDFGGSI